MSEQLHGTPRVLHVIVGHGLPTYFLNAVRSIRSTAPLDQLLVIDNASPEAELRVELSRLAADDDHIEVMFRATNDVALNGKVGELYLAYAAAVDYATSRGFDLLHIFQGDMQTLWWSEDVVTRAFEIFDENPRCVNIYMVMLSSDKTLTTDVVDSSTPGVKMLRRYGLTDTGLYHLGRWRDLGMEFAADETIHAQRYLDAGFEVLCHPWPTDAQIPWPAVVRRGVRVGKEVARKEAFLLKPLSVEDVMRLKASDQPVPLEEYCIPWGWLCMSPMWLTDAGSIDYWVLRYRKARRDGIVAALPRFDRRGVPAHSWVRLFARFEHRPPLWRLIGLTAVHEIETRASAWSATRRWRRSRTR